MADASIVSGELLVQSSACGGKAVITTFGSDDVGDDLVVNEDIDLADMAQFQLLFTGTN